MLARHALSNATLLAVALLTPPSASSQNLAITNARIIVGSGQVIDSGTLIVRDGKIATVTGGSVQIPRELPVIDAKGMSAMPGFRRAQTRRRRSDRKSLDAIAAGGGLHDSSRWRRSG